MTSPQLARAARRLADQQTSLLAGVRGPQRIKATIAAITSGAGTDGRATITVQWRGNAVLAAGWNASQTFAVGQRVVCDLIDGQLTVDYPIVGTP